MRIGEQLIMKISEKIEEKRQELINAVDGFNNLDADTIKKSEELDEVIMAYYNNKSKIKLGNSE